ncbi:hypothetical protein K435DRAFT_807093 [Dendrothele bispora CBS 962.96]|uniref:Uncharacterized protein n=1 Tax=Dendrothele bispora (strain CBS 962.96) TaxID=1314807 RepID=A0A4S8L677_DENBC|nr:hypothetical protein K435DRAFT_807093 [Dendrothele bispora CBS 962.96]
MSAIDDTTYSILVMRNIPSIASFLAAFIAIYGSKYQTLLKSSFLNYAQDSSIIADIVLIHRCYKIWGANKKITVLSIFISIMNNAGRIWWIGHQVSKFLPTRKFNLTRQSMAVCLESGIMYPLALIPTLVLIFVNGIDLTAILIQVVGIAPTFIITVLSMWEANHNIDECVQKDQTAVAYTLVILESHASVKQVGQTIYDQILLEIQSILSLLPPLMLATTR